MIVRRVRIESIVVDALTYFQEVIFSKQTAGTIQEVPSERGNHLKGRKFVSKICRVKMSLDFLLPAVVRIVVSFCVKTKRIRKMFLKYFMEFALPTHLPKKST
jgi:hypothetical protein